MGKGKRPAPKDTMVRESEVADGPIMTKAYWDKIKQSKEKKK